MAAPPLIHGTLIATVQYDANGGLNAPSESSKVKTYVGEGFQSRYVPVTSSVPTRDGYSFTKWNTSPDTVTTSTAIAYFASGQLYVNFIKRLDVRIVGSGDNTCALFSGRLS